MSGRGEEALRGKQVQEIKNMRGIPRQLQPKPPPQQLPLSTAYAHLGRRRGIIVIVIVVVIRLLRRIIVILLV